MRWIEARLASVVAAGMIIGGLPLLAFALLLLNLSLARNAGQTMSGDAIGLAVMSLIAYGLAVLSFAIGAAYFGFRRARHQLVPNSWHRFALVFLAIEVIAPPLYFSIF